MSVFAVASLLLVAVVFLCLIPALGLRRSWAACAVTVLVGGVCASGTMALQVSPFEGPDEAAHFDYIAWVAERGLPTGLPNPRSSWAGEVYEWQQPPFYYLVGAGLVRAFDLPIGPTALPVDPSSRLAGGKAFIVCKIEARARPLLATLTWLRAVAVAGAGLTALLMFAGLRRAVGCTPFTAACLTMVVVLTPSWSALMGHASNDGFVALLATLAVCLAITAGAPSSEAPRATWLAAAGAAAGLAVVTKLTGLFLIPFGVVAAWCLWTGQPRQRLARAATFLAGAALSGGWVFARNLWTFGDVLARPLNRSVIADLPPQAVIGFFDARLPRVLHQTVLLPFWARFGSLGAGPPESAAVWSVYYSLTICVAAVLALGAWSVAATGEHRRVGIPVLTGIVAGMAVWIFPIMVPLGHANVFWTPRYLQPLTLPGLLLFALGCRFAARDLSERARTGTAIALVVVLAACYADSLAWLRIQYP